MRRDRFKVLFFTVSLSWIFFYLWNAIPNTNLRYYAVPLSDVRINVADDDRGPKNYELLPGREKLRDEGVDSVFITQVPVANYRPIYGPLLVTIICLIVSALPKREKSLVMGDLP